LQPGVPFGQMDISNPHWRQNVQAYGRESFKRMLTEHYMLAERQTDNQASEHVATPQEHVADSAHGHMEPADYDSDDSSIGDEVYKSLGLDIPTTKPPPMIDPHEFSESDHEDLGNKDIDAETRPTIPGSDDLDHDLTTPRMMAYPFQDVPKPTPFASRVVPDVDSNKYVIKADHAKTAAIPLGDNPEGPQVVAYPRQRPNRSKKDVRKDVRKTAPKQPPVASQPVEVSSSPSKQKAPTTATGTWNAVCQILSPAAYSTAQVPTSSSSSESSTPSKKSPATSTRKSRRAQRVRSKAKGTKGVPEDSKSHTGNPFAPLADPKGDSEEEESANTSSQESDSQNPDFQEGGTN